MLHPRRQAAEQKGKAAREGEVADHLHALLRLAQTSADHQSQKEIERNHTERGGPREKRDGQRYKQSTHPAIRRLTVHFRSFVIMGV